MWRVEQVFNNELSAPADARQFCAHELTEGIDGIPELGGLVERAVLIVSELVTNSVKANGAHIRLVMAVDNDRLRLGVTDDGSGWPTRVDSEVSDPGGRGLEIVEKLSDRWGIERSGDEKCVWVELAVRASDEFALSSENGSPSPRTT
jgi:hypothetical protein